MSFVYGKQLIKININHIFSSSSLLKLFHSQFCKKKPHNIVYKHYNPSVRITPLMLCALIWIHKWRDLQFKVDSERQFLVRRLFNVCVRVFCAPNVTIFLVYILAKVKMSFIWKDNFLPKSASSVSRSQVHSPALFKRIHNHIRSAER